jgi:energy-coupling factor transporter ATP-binding protein EcfA2
VTESTVPATRLENPFPGLRPFRENEVRLFFGRESQIDTMVEKLAAIRFLAVVGTSGSGKSSLVNCGLNPALSRGLMASAGTAWRIAKFRPGSDPIKAMAQSLAQPGLLFRDQDFEGLSAQEIVETTLGMSKLGLVDIYEQAHFPEKEKPNLLVIVDQFEELFRFQNLQSAEPGPNRAFERSVAFVNLLLEAVSSDLPIYVVLTMRSDFLGDCAQFFGLAEAINRGQYLVPRMSRDERRSAIAGPVAVAGGDISSELLTRLVNDVGDNPDQLSILQHALNRTWAEWQREGGAGAMDLPHYEAIGTMLHALDFHAERAYAELGDDRQKVICEKVFQALTDKGPYLRGIRRPTSVAALCAITETSLDELNPVFDVFRKPSRSFVMPPAGEPIAPETIMDISHESLMRIWVRLTGWVNEEAESAAQYQRLVQNTSLKAEGKAGLMTDPELSLTLEWRKNWKPNAAWAERYKPGFASAIAFLEESREKRDADLAAERARQDAERAAEQERLKRKLRRKWQIAAAVATAVALTVAVVSRVRVANLRERQAIALSQAEARRRVETENLNVAVTNERDAAKNAEAKAKAADERAELEAQMFIDAIKAKSELDKYADKQLEVEEIQEMDTDAKKSATVLAQDKLEVGAMTSKTKDLTLIAGRKFADAYAFIADAHIISPSQISGSDLFDVAHGESQVTGYSGGSHTRNPNDMFSGSHGSPDRATIFEDGQRVGFEHWVEWKTRNEVTLKSVGLFAAHDANHLRRSFSNFKLFVKKNGQWVAVTEYSPSLVYGYGVSCGPKSCFPPPAVQYAPGAVLAACVNLPPTTGQQFRAVFVQSVSKLDGFTGPRVLQLDGYQNSNCSQ